MAKGKKNGKGKKIVICILTCTVILVLMSTIVVTQKDEYTLIKQFGRVERIIDDPGISFKIPFIQEVETLPNKLMSYDQAPSDAITKDKKNMVIDNFVIWRITDPLKFVQTLHTRAEAERRIQTVIYNAIKNEISQMNQDEIIEGRKGNLSEGIVEKVQPSFAPYGIEVIDNEIKRLDLPAENKQSVYDRMISERKQIAAQFIANGEENYQKIVNETDKEVQILLSTAKAEAEQIRGEGEAEYMKILAAAYNTEDRASFYEFCRSLEAIRNTMNGNKTLFLPIDSPLTEIFINGK